jgi:hypothetical protein
VANAFSRIARHVAAVLAAYALFTVLSTALFAFSGRDPHAAQETAFVVFSILYGVLAAVLCGYLAGAIGGGNPIPHARTLALGIAAVAVVSLLARPGQGAVWTQLASLLVFAPSALVGGWLRRFRGATRSLGR